MGCSGRYVSGLGVATLGLCAAGWLALTPYASGDRGRGPHAAAVTDLATGGGLAVVSLITLVSWALAWRRKLRTDAALPPSRRQARREARERRGTDGGGAPDPDRVLSELRTLLAPLLPEPPDAQDEPEGIAALESMLAGARLLMTGGGEEEAW
jgi:hypothetical protein